MEELIDIIRQPFQSGLLTFFAGVLSILAVYHFLLYFQQKIRSYFFYSLYLFLVLFSIFRFSSGRYHEIYITYFSEFMYLLTEVTFVVYLFFAYSFLEMKRNAPRWNKYVMGANWIFLGIAILIHLISYFVGGSHLRYLGYNFFLIYMPILAVLSYYPILKKPIPLRFYLIIGSLILFLGWLGPVLVYQLNMGRDNFRIASGFFLLAGIFENLFFSLGLGHKQKLLLQENRQAKLELIRQNEENEKLRSKVQQKLEANVEILSKQVERDKIEKLTAQYERELAELKVNFLRSQMNPHFIFNSLNSIKLYIINNEKENAVYYLNKFSKFIRKVLDATREKISSLTEELETIQLYVNIENIRFDNQINFTVKIEEELDLQGIKVPSLILQSFVENAIWHGLPLVDRKQLTILVKKESEKEIKIAIEDNGIGMKRSKEINRQKFHQRRSVGLQITKERLQIFYKDYGGSYSLTYAELNPEKENPGTRVELRIPLS
ncbi:sensor histidine kinase [Salinimicrobium sediminilitoris]|uniref:sensor histidine kinase n=1 Tax=Salinimicrobium sediminilitoris TaxID=2876715 RepID=UPI001E5E2781|nr:histidine kinase [Salinimicrobium sediminilitoris]MCC8360210.1 histidine kinase [Salinimicrobium sediminilitoris]